MMTPWACFSFGLLLVLSLTWMPLPLNANDDIDINSTIDLSPFTFSSLDMLSHEQVRRALKQLRTRKTDSKNRVIPKKPQEIIEALEELHTAGNGDKSTLSMRGNTNSKTNPDDSAVSVIVSPFLSFHEDNQNTGMISQFMGIFDGHFSQPHVSAYAAKALPQRLASGLLELTESDLANPQVVTNVITEAFHYVDQNEPTGGYGGSTASIVLQLNETIYMANAGTSQTFIGMAWESWEDPIGENDVIIVLESPTTTPDKPEEAQRITTSGGVLTRHRDTDEVRVYPPNNQQHGHPGIPMSRSIGDWSILPGVIATPKIGVFTLDVIVQFGMEGYDDLVCGPHKNEEGEEEEEESDDEDDEEVTYEKETVEEVEEIEQCETDEETIFEADGEDDYEKEEESCPKPKALHLFAMAATEGVLAYPDALSSQDIGLAYAASFFVDGNPHPHTASEAVLIEAAHAYEEEYEGQYRVSMAVAAMKLWDV